MKKFKILMSGGGTGGPVAPLLAVLDLLRKTDLKYEFIWVGTKYGPERNMVEAKQIDFYAIASGKWRRYFSFKNILDIFNVIIGFIESFIILTVQKPDMVMSAGGFVSVPLVWAAWLMRIKIFIHQQDLIPGLANKLMAPCADIISVTFEKSLRDYGDKAVWTGNPIRSEFKERVNCPDWEKAREIFGLRSRLPLVLVIGGGTGSLALNMLLTQSLPDLTKYVQIIHVAGAKKSNRSPLKWVDSDKSANYKSYDFLDAQKMSYAVQAADIVVSRCGMGFLSELSFLGKASILIPLPGSQQEENADLFREKSAAIVLYQGKLNSSELVKQIRILLENNDLRTKLQNNISALMKKDGEANIVELIEKYGGKN